MKLTKNNIIELLKSVHLQRDAQDIISEKRVKNVVIMGDDILIDLEIKNPTLQSKNKIKNLIKSKIESKIKQPFQLQINFKLNSEKNQTIYNNNGQLNNVKNIIAISVPQKLVQV